MEKDELLGTLEFEEAIAAFIHICFVCDIKYPKVVLIRDIEVKEPGGLFLGGFYPWGYHSAADCQVWR